MSPVISQIANIRAQVEEGLYDAPTVAVGDVKYLLTIVDILQEQIVARDKYISQSCQKFFGGNCLKCAEFCLKPGAPARPEKKCPIISHPMPDLGRDGDL